MTLPPPDLTTLHPAFQAGYTAGNKDARQHRKRNRVLDDRSGLDAYAVDAALADLPLKERMKERKARAGLVAQYVDGYTRAYRLATGQ